MIGHVAVCLLLFAPASGPEINAAQFSEVVRKGFESLRTVVFVYEGQTRWVGPSNLGMTPESFDDEFQGAYLYREDGAGLVDVYVGRKNPTTSVVRKKKAVLSGKSETIRGLLDAKTPINPSQDILIGPGSTSSLFDVSGTQDLFWSAWYWRERGDLNTRNYKFQGWEDVDGHACLRFQIDTYPNSDRHDLNFRKFWVDVSRNAHVVKVESYTDGKLTKTIDVSLIELSSRDGKKFWFPAKSQSKTYVWEKVYYARPITEQTIAVVDGSLQTNVNLPDSLFSVKRATALPTTDEASALSQTGQANDLRHRFATQPAKEAFRTDPLGIRHRIDKNLAEADRQARELEASSPARTFWNGTTTIQGLCVLLSLGLLGAVVYWRRTAL